MAVRVRLRDLLDERRISQTELQLKTGLGYSTINALYHDKTERVEFSTLDKLCDFFACEPGDLFIRTREKGRS